MTIDVGYALGQLQRALETAQGGAAPEVRTRAAAKVASWQAVLRGMSDGTLDVGSRTPVRDVPAWVTLDVARGGFATGGLAAGGDLLAHERDLLARIGAGDAPSARAALNAYYLSDEGRGELAALLKEGTYHLDVPEEGALLVVAWLLAHGEGARAQEVLDTIAPYLDRLRFYPHPRPCPRGGDDTVRAQPVAKTLDQIERVGPNAQVAKMNETLAVWRPLEDRAVALFLETVDGEAPRFLVDPSGALQRRESGAPIVEGGWPCRRWPEGWEERAKAWLADVAAARPQHPLCRRPVSAKDNLARLRRALERCVEDPRTLSGRDVGMIRTVVAARSMRHGAPDSEALRRLREEQVHVASRPLHASSRRRSPHACAPCRGTAESHRSRR